MYANLACYLPFSRLPNELVSPRITFVSDYLIVGITRGDKAMLRNRSDMLL